MIKYAEHWVFNPQSHLQITGATLPAPGALGRLLIEQDRHMLMTGMAHADYEVGRLRRRYAPRQLASLVDSENAFRVVPEHAMAALQASDLILAVDVEADLLTGLKRIGLQQLAGDIRRREAEAAVAQLANTTAARARNIVTTNGTRAYNQGRLEQFKELDVGHVLFRAILDDVTSRQCRTRHGLIMATNDPRLKQNTPPLHGH
jgi:SPP1 gp7 family putative phage head morphogenesis protein